MKRTLLPLLALLMIFQVAQSQTVGGMTWQSEEDFRAAEPNVIENIVWLEEHPLATESNDTKAISEYVIQWLSETPYVTVRLDEHFTAPIVNDKNYKYADKFRVTYLFGKSLHAMTNPNYEAAVACQRGVEGMVKVYEELLKFDSEAQHRELDKFLRLAGNQQLEAYVRDQLEESGG